MRWISSSSCRVGALGLLLVAACATPEAAPEPQPESPPTSLHTSELELRSGGGRLVTLMRIEGGVDYETGKLYARPIPAPEEPPRADGVGVNAQALAGFCPVIPTKDGVVGSGAAGTIEFYTVGPETPETEDDSSLDKDVCLMNSGYDAGPHASLFATDGIGCAKFAVNNFADIAYDQLYIDIDIYHGTIAHHAPYQYPIGPSTVDDTALVGRNAPSEATGLWTLGPVAAGSPASPAHAEAWVFFREKTPSPFRWTGSLVALKLEVCDNGIDDDCDGEQNNGCGDAIAGAGCFADSDCGFGNLCVGQKLTKSFGAGPGDADVPGECMSTECADLGAPYVGTSDANCEQTRSAEECWLEARARAAADCEEDCETGCTTSLSPDDDCTHLSGEDGYQCAAYCPAPLQCGTHAHCETIVTDGECVCDAGHNDWDDDGNCALPFCGDGHTDEGETCDDGNAETEACAYGETECTVCDSTCHSVAGATSLCGDGVVDGAAEETCDDGNTVTEACAYGDDDGCTVCDAACHGVAGATSFCGDDFVDTFHDEECDDGDTASYDGCDAACKEEPDCYPPSIADDLGTYTGTTVGAGDDQNGSCEGGDGEDVIYEYTAHHNGSVCIDTVGSAIPDTQLHVQDVCGDAPSEAACNDDGVGLLSRLQLTVGVGDVAYVVVDGYGSDDQGSYQLNIKPGSCCPDGMIDVGGTGATCAAVVQMSIGSSHACAITELGTLYCWGANSYGQLGDNSTTQRLRPTLVAGGFSDWAAVAVGNDMTCARRAGQLYCWGSNSAGQLGDGTMNNRAFPAAVSGNHSDWGSFSAGSNHACGVRSGTLYCWGGGSSGQLGNGGTASSPTPTLVSGGFTDWTLVDVGTNGASCGVRATGHGYCWGFNGNAQLGTGGTTQSYVPTLLAGGYTDWTSVGVAGFHGCGLRADGRAYCWGLGSNLGNGSATQTGTPTEVSGMHTGWSGLTVADASCAIRVGRTYCWGGNYSGALGDGTTTSSLVPVQVVGDHTNWSAVSSGGYSTCGLRSGGMYCWGNNQYGQLGLGYANNRPLPARVGGEPSDWQAVTTSGSSMDGNHSCGLRGGRIYCWGRGGGGRLGDGASMDRALPTEVSGGFTDWESVSSPAVASAYGHTCALRAGRIYCWGYNGSGQLGDGSNMQRTVPTLVSGGYTDWQSVSAGSTHGCGIRGGQIYCWGNNWDGQLGNGTTTASNVPVLASGGFSDWQQVHAGNSFTCGLRAGRAYCWGYNYNGQLGDNSTASRNVPTQVNGSHADWQALSVGYNHACGLRSGNAYCWGYNVSGQLGDGTSVQKLVPTAVTGGLSGFQQIEAGFYFSCGVRSGYTHCWGQNNSGQLGDGTLSTRLAPAVLGGAYTGWQSVAAGYYHACGIRAGRLYCWGSNGSGELGLGSGLSPLPIEPI